MRHSQKPPALQKRRGAFAFSGAKILAILDPFRTSSGPYDFKKDSSHLILLSLAKRGHPIFYSDPSSLFVTRNKLMVNTSRVSVLESDPFFVFHKKETHPVNRFALVLMRKDPPVDPVYFCATQLLSMATIETWVLNDPAALRNWNEKLIILNFPRWIPSTLVSTNPQEIDFFVQSLGGTALSKPLEGFGGKGVVKLCREEANYTSDLDRITDNGRKAVMVQDYLPEIVKGEKRVVMIDGRPIGALLKIPAEGSFLANPDLGARLETTQLTSREKRLCQTVGPFLKKNGIFFAGLDLIGEKLTEINITSPGLLWEWNEVDNQRHEEEIVDLIEKRL